MRKILLSFIICLLSVQFMHGQQTIFEPKSRVASSFAIFIDKASYEACKESVNKYKELLESEGLATYLLVADWESPEHVKYFIKKYYNEQALEGAVFIGDIPIALIRKGQYLTSAFKMNEQRYPMRDSSVPSDRFYDDLNLKFDFIARDSVEKNFFYYNLSPYGAQKINCTIYSGRIKPTKQGAEGHKQINDYLNKVVQERSKENILDRVASYTGNGSYSNSLSAWSSEGVTLREQMPACFKDADGAKFYMFYMKPFMKETVISELKREDLDLMLFHEHGLPHRMYLTAASDYSEDEDLFKAGKLAAREGLRRAIALGRDTSKYIKSMLDKGIKRSWFNGTFDKQVMQQDSLDDLAHGIVLEDVPAIAPNPRVVIFDACYNGDFREQSCIASEFIFAGGKTIACFANSVNVLQDKSAVDLMGLLSCGLRMGQWTQNINILESHIIGDPTFRFKPYRKFPQIKLNTKDPNYWIAVLKHNLPCDLKGLALYKLFNFNYPKMEELLMSIYKSSNEWMLRLQCMHLMAYYGGDSYAELLKLAVNDPYEFIRRKAAYFMGNVGRNEFVPYLVNLYLDDYLSERVTFNITRSAGMLNAAYFLKLFEQKIDKGGYVFDKEEFKRIPVLAVKRGEGMVVSMMQSLLDKSKSDKSRVSSITTVKNNPSVELLSDLLMVLKDKSESDFIRCTIAETLGWYFLCERKAEIVDVCKEILLEEKITDSLKDELNKTINRLQTYMR